MRRMEYSEVLLYATNFFESKEDEREFDVIQNNKFYKVKIGKQTYCECDDPKFECIHKRFIFKMMFYQDSISQSYEKEELERMKRLHIENSDQYDCSMCHKTVMGNKEVFYFPKYRSYTHKECFDTVMIAITVNKSDTVEYLKYLEDLNYDVINGETLYIKQKKFVAPQSINNKRKEPSSDDPSPTEIRMDRRNKHEYFHKKPLSFKSGVSGFIRSPFSDLGYLFPVIPPTNSFSPFETRNQTVNLSRGKELFDGSLDNNNNLHI
eukprot:TRINITY_DN5690_c0_g1_i1.p1 TRINITY_DN5690_c0_g1~~TRINITY_DN5690_c0_g1_i1.p1  ORF type:complete len:265 (-),score=54.30 TRINITY_DN5690_c0_g1_i1:53-847(-)